MRTIVSVGCAASLLLCTPSGFGAAQTTDVDPLLSSAHSWDLNGDGIYTCDEWKVFVNKVFDRADKNHDGHVDAQEFKTIKNADPLFRDADLGYFDEDHDGRLSRREFVDKPSPFFLRFDKNGDCRVTPDELKGASAEGEKTGAGSHRHGRGGGLR